MEQNVGIAVGGIIGILLLALIGLVSVAAELIAAVLGAMLLLVIYRVVKKS